MGSQEGLMKKHFCCIKNYKFKFYIFFAKNIIHNMYEIVKQIYCVS